VKPTPSAYSHTGKAFSVEFQRLESDFVDHWTARVRVDLGRASVEFHIDAAPWRQVQDEIRKLGGLMHRAGMDLSAVELEKP
jgi:hypothetical protein